MRTIVWEDGDGGEGMLLDVFQDLTHLGHDGE